MLATPSTRYNPLHKPNQVICGTGQTVVITGWTVRNTIAKHLQPREYAAIGQLYSATRGINLLIRNLIANPHVRYLVILDATKEDKNARACECLRDFFKHGFDAGVSDTGRSCWVINSPVPGYIDREIPAPVLQQLRDAVEWRLVTDKDSACQLAKSYASQDWQPPWGEPQEFPLVENTPEILPGPRYGHRIEGKTIAETWVKIIHRIKTTGTLRPTGYDGRWQELIDLVAVITEEPEDFYFPEPNYLPVDRDFIKEYIQTILNDAPYREGVKYTYGQRLRSWFDRDQVEQVIEKLIGEIDAASAVMSLWDVRDHDKGGSPCLNHIWVRVVDNELSLTATLRSNDMFAAWPANAMGLRALQKHIRDRICDRTTYQLRLGPLITISQSAHIYDDCWENADRLIQDQYANIVNSRDFYDPSGNFQIELENDRIVVQRLTPGSGEVVATYRGKKPLNLMRDICADAPVLHAEHAGYLGMELQKAYNCLTNDIPYMQDA